jgi:proteasome lid subunit RPN8/RPN11
MTDIASQLLAEFPEALDCGAEERCGVVRPDGTIWQIANIHPQPKQGFVMEPKSFLDEVEAGAAETWHTHPGQDPNLSEEDMAGFMQWPDLVHHIVGIRDGKPTIASFKVVDDVLVNA